MLSKNEEQQLKDFAQGKIDTVVVDRSNASQAEAQLRATIFSIARDTTPGKTVCFKSLGRREVTLDKNTEESLTSFVDGKIDELEVKVGDFVNVYSLVKALGIDVITLEKDTHILLTKC